MDKLDQILQVVGENQKTLADIGIHLPKIDVRLGGIEVRLGDFDVRFKDLDSRIGRLEDNIVGINTRLDSADSRAVRLEDNIVAINTRLMTVEENVAKLPHIEQVIDQTFGKIDGFMVILNRFESEIAATRMKYEFLEERVATLESHPKT